MILPDKTEKKIKALMKQYGWTKWETMVNAIDREHEEMKIVQKLIKKGSEDETRRGNM